MLAALVFAAALPATASPLAQMNYLVGTWNCTYRAGATRFLYDNTYAYDLDGHALRQNATWTGGGDEELVAYDAQHRSWTAVVFDGTGTTTIMRGTGDPAHIVYRSVYPDASINEAVDRLSATQYTIHATVRSGGKTTASVDTCVRAR